MNRRRLCAGLLACLIAAGCGGRQSIVTFAPENQDLAKALSTALGKKDMNGVRLAQRAADNRERMANDEKEAFKTAVSMAEKSEWDQAKDYIDKCLASGK